MTSTRITILGSVLLVILLGLHFFARSILTYLCREDGILESLTAIFYFISAVCFLSLWVKSGCRNIWFLGYLVLFFLIAGEEVSWGQRLFDIEVPEKLEQMNVQKELNFHNIDGIHGMIRELGLMVVVVICYVIPVTNHLFQPFRSFYLNSGMPIFPLQLWIIPTIAILLMVIPKVMQGAGIFNINEAGETYLSVGFLGFALTTWNANKS